MEAVTNEILIQSIKALANLLSGGQGSFISNALNGIASILGFETGGYVPQVNRESGGFIPQVNRETGGFVPQVNRETGGFVPQLAYAESGGFRSNRVMVGENGREIVDLPAGSRVRSAGETRDIKQSQNIVLNFGDDVLGIVKSIKREMRQAGVDDVNILIAGVNS